MSEKGPKIEHAFGGGLSDSGRFDRLGPEWLVASEGTTSPALMLIISLID